MGAQTLASHHTASLFISINFRIDSCDLLIIVIDTKDHFNRIISQGIEDFLKDHLVADLDMSNPEQIITSKQILVCLNKMDLLDNDQSKALNISLITSSPSKNIQVSRTSCVENQIRISNIDELVSKLKEKLSDL